MKTSELIAQLSKCDPNAEVQVGWSVGNGIYRERASVAVRKGDGVVTVAGESRAVKSAASTTPKPAAKSEGKRAPLTLVSKPAAAKPAAAKSTSKPAAKSAKAAAK